MKGWIKVHMISTGDVEWIQVSKIRCVWDTGNGSNMHGMIEYSDEEKEEVQEKMDEIMNKIAEAI